MSNVDFLAQLADYVAPLLTGGYSTTTPANVFVGKYPGEPDNIVVFLGQVGQAPNIDIEGINTPHFQVLVRNTDYQIASTLLRQVRDLLHDSYSVRLPNFFVWRIQAFQEGYPLGQDDQGRSEFSINFMAEERYGDSIGDTDN